MKKFPVNPEGLKQNIKKFPANPEGLKQNIKGFPANPEGLKQNIKEFPVTFEELKQITKEFPTPFYLYDEKAIRENIRRLYKAFSWNTSFREYFVVKTTPNPFILKLFKEEGCGVDCASFTELILADSCGFSGDDIMFTSNVTTKEEFIKAKNLDAIINLDDYFHIEYLKDCAGIPELVCLRLNPDCTITYLDNIILDYKDYKFGFTEDTFKEGIKLLKKNGARRFGLHCQFGSHRREAEYFGENARLVFKKAVEICSTAGIT
jgi:diaminopimelate decarboxylase